MLSVTGFSGTDTTTKITIKNVEIYPTVWNNVTPVWHPDMQTYRDYRDEIGIVGRVVAGDNRFFPPEAPVAGPRAAWGYRMENIVEPILDSHEDRLPVLEFIWQTGDVAFERYKVNGGPEIEIDADRYPIAPYLRRGTWYVPIRLFAEMLGVPGATDDADNNNLWATFDLDGNVDGAQIRVPAVDAQLTVILGSPDMTVHDGVGPRYVFLTDAAGNPVNAELFEGRIFVPLRALLQALNLTVDHIEAVDGWEGAMINKRY